MRKVTAGPATPVAVTGMYNESLGSQAVLGIESNNLVSARISSTFAAQALAYPNIEYRPNMAQGELIDRASYPAYAACVDALPGLKDWAATPFPFVCSQIGGARVTVAYGNGRYVCAPSLSGCNWVFTTTDLRSVWSVQPTLQPASSHCSIAFGNGRFIMTNNASTQAQLTSLNGLTWNLTGNVDAGQVLKHVRFLPGANLFVAMGNTASNVYYTTADGVAWTSRTVPAAAPNLSNFADACVSGTRLYYLSSQTAAPALGYTDDGITWTGRTLPAILPVLNPLGIAADVTTNRILVIMQGGTAWLSNDNGVNWVSSKIPPVNLNTGVPNSVVFSTADNCFYASQGSSSGIYYKSIDGLNWTTQYLPDPGNAVTNFLVVNGLLFALLQGGNIYMDVKGIVPADKVYVSALSQGSSIMTYTRVK